LATEIRKVQNRDKKPCSFAASSEQQQISPEKR